MNPTQAKSVNVPLSLKQDSKEDKDSEAEMITLSVSEHLELFTKWAKNNSKLKTVQ